jgi:hypothetical protein
MPNRELHYHPLAIWNIPDNRHFFREEDSGLYSYMFIEDITNHIMPYYAHSSSSNKLFQVNISNPSLETEAKALFHFSYGNDPFFQPLSEVVFEFIRKVTSFLLVKGGKAYFEVVEAIIDNNEVSKPVHILNPIPGRVIRFGKTYYQMIPNGVKEVKERYIPIPQSKIWALEISKDLGRVKDIIALSKNLGDLGKASFLASEIITNPKDFFGFDVNNFHSSIDAAVLQATKKWGWDKRMGLNNQHALEYYLYYRMLRFGYSMAILRTDMLSKMNDLLRRLGYDATMSFFGIPTPDELLNAISKMEQRQLSFKEVTDLIYFAL